MTSNLGAEKPSGPELAGDRVSGIKAVIDLSRWVIYTCNADGDFAVTYISNGAKLLWGYEPDEFLAGSRFWLDRVHPEDRPRILGGLQGLSAAGEQTHEYRFRVASGEYRWVRGDLRVVRDASGNPLEIAGMCIDITPEKNAESLLRGNQDRLTAIFNATSDWQMLIRVGPNGYLAIETINDALAAVFALLAPPGNVLVEQAIEKTLGLIGFSPQQIEFRLSLFRKVVSEKKSTHYEAYGFPKGLAVEVTVSPVLDEDGCCNYILWTGRDVTARNAAMLALRREARDLREAQRIAKVGSWYRTSDMEHPVWSEQMYRIYGLDLNGPPPSAEKLREFFTPQAWELRTAALDQMMRDGQPCEMTLELFRADGKKRWIEAMVEVERDRSGGIVGLRGTAHDVTDQREMELALQTREKQLALIFNSTTDAKALLRVMGEGKYRIEAVNRAYEQLVATAFGASGVRLEGRDRNAVLADFGFPEEAIREELPLYERAVQENRAVHAEATFPGADGSSVFAEVSVRPIHVSEGPCTHVLWSGRDITERKKAEIQLRTSLREKETLLREVHHRVKNNLQIISSLLHFQAKNTTDPSAIAVFRQGQDRLRSMVLVHEKLYRSSNLAAIDFADYVQSLTSELARSHELRSRGIQLRVEAEPILLPAEMVLPCGMIISELVTNAFKHGYPAGRSGTISVKVTLPDGAVKIEVEDDGVGVPVDVRDGPHGFGADLIQSLSEQIGGSITYRHEPGTKVTIFIPYDNLHQRNSH